jgi:hypothetical protein
MGRIVHRLTDSHISDYAASRGRNSVAIRSGKRAALHCKVLDRISTAHCKLKLHMGGTGSIKGIRSLHEHGILRKDLQKRVYTIACNCRRITTRG